MVEREWLKLRHNNSPTRSGNQLAHNAHERIIRRNPTARKKERKITANILSSNMVIVTELKETHSLTLPPLLKRVMG